MRIYCKGFDILPDMPICTKVLRRDLVNYRKNCRKAFVSDIIREEIVRSICDFG